MFNRKEKNLSTLQSLNQTHSTLSFSAKITGEIKAEDNLRIDGNVDGNIHCNGRIIVGPEGCIRGNIESNSIELMGKVYGDVAASEFVILKATSYYKGEIKTRNIEIEAGACFFGKCSMEE